MVGQVAETGVLGREAVPEGRAAVSDERRPYADVADRPRLAVGVLEAHTRRKVSDLERRERMREVAS
jgi:hypothetical protein